MTENEEISWMSVGGKLDHFIRKQAALVALDREVGEKVKAIEAKANAECEAISKNAMIEANEVRAPLLKQLEEYRAEVKAEFGITDGEGMSVIHMLKAVHAMTQKDA